MIGKQDLLFTPIELFGGITKNRSRKQYTSDPICDSTAFEMVRDEVKFAGKYELPVVDAYTGSTNFVMCSYPKRNDKKCEGMHFFAPDKEFEYAITKRLDETIKKLLPFKLLIGPDFSLFRDKDKICNLNQIRKSRLITVIFQKLGFPVVPVVSYSNADSFEYCFDGLPKHSVLATCGTGKSATGDRNLFLLFLKEMINRLCPKEILIYGPKFDAIWTERQT